MQLAANLGAGNADFNLPRFRLYRDNLDAIRSWTTLRMNMRPGICVPETMRFDGSGWYTGTDEGNSSCDSFGPASYNKRNLSTGAEVGLNIWRQYLQTDDRAFLENNYPLMADAARFLLAYAVEGADGKLHTSPSNAHETQWDVTDPITDIAAMKSLFPAVIEAAQLLGTDAALVTQLQTALPKILDFPRTTRNNQTVFGFCSNPTAAFNNSENLDLEPLFPYNLISDQTTADFELSKTTYANRRNINSNDWSYDAVDAARLGNGDRGRVTAARVGELVPALRQRHGRPRLGRHADQHLRRAGRHRRPHAQRGAGAGLRRPRPDRPRGPARLDRRGDRRAAAQVARSTCRCRTVRSPRPRWSTARPPAASGSRTRGRAATRRSSRATTARPSSCPRRAPRSSRSRRPPTAPT